ncbi:energy transducer TonB [Modicisalibacter muralis]|uniref:energy transducer TonB n=1 Tax=Modicisalibacter muralis TaxID=119000 RepID=UPI000B7EDF19|nr:energy transducer TonB [Halomonas muralis]
MRQSLGSLGGVLLALLLFTLLALLVAPPEDDRPVIEMPVSVSMVEAPTPQPSAEAPAPAAPSPPVSTPPPPPPAPMPAPNLDSAIAIPTPETPPLEVSKVPLDTRLPELTAIEPEPEPEPEPQPESPPQPAPEPAQPSPSPSQALARTNEAPSEQSGGGAPSSAQGVIDSPQPTSRIPPEYPSRALRRGLEGYVEVRFTILPDGSVDADSLRVIDAQPRHTFERAAMQAISRWQFSESAGTREARQRLEFRLEG